MRCRLAFATLCVVSLFLMLYNLVLLSSRKPLLRLVKRERPNWRFFERERQKQQGTIETTLEMQGNTEISENKQGFQFRNKLEKVLLAGHNRSRGRDESKAFQTLAPRRNLIILSPGRGGSSFLGGIFDSNPQVMYWFEPLHTIRREVFKMHLLKEKHDSLGYKETCNNVVDSFFKCDFSNITKATLSKFSKTIFRYRSKSLTTGNLCSPGKSTSRRCRPFSRTLLTEACNSYKHTVIKILTSRVPNKTLQSFQELFQQDRYEVKLIHLVRDPRAVLYSMVNSVKWIKKENYSDQDFRSHIHGTCDQIRQNIRMGLLNPPSWLRNRFKVIRFEDLAVNTPKYALELYSFAGFDWSNSVDKWISAHDRPPSNAKEGNAYSLYRNASDVINKWKNAPKDLIKAVEEICGDLMDTLGYERLITKQDRKQDVNFI